MKVAVCQTNPVLLDLKTNIADVIRHIHRCKKKGVDLIVFPELALTGYFVGRNFHSVALRMDSDEIITCFAIVQVLSFFLIQV